MTGEEVAAQVWGEASEQAHAFASVQLAEMGLSIDGDALRDIFEAGIEAGKTGMILALRDRSMLSPGDAT